MDRASSKQGRPRAWSRHQQNGLYAWRSSLWLWPSPIRSSQFLVYAQVCIHVHPTDWLNNCEDEAILKNSVTLSHVRWQSQAGCVWAQQHEELKPKATTGIIWGEELRYADLRIRLQ